MAYFAHKQFLNWNDWLWPLCVGLDVYGQLSNLQKGMMKKGMPKKYNNLSIPKVLETAKQRLAALGSCLERYTRKTEARRINHPRHS